MQRVSVVGSPGAGKTTFARRLADVLGANHVELDALHHLPGWTERPTEELRALVAAELGQPRWVVDGNYGSKVQDLVWARADSVVFLDLARRTVMRRVVVRSLRRLVTREELWNANREQLRYLTSRDPEENIILWTWTHYHEYRSEYCRAMADPTNPHLGWVHLRSPRAVTAFLSSLPSSPSNSSD